MSEAAHEPSKQGSLWKKLKTESKFLSWSWNCHPSKVPASRKIFFNKIKLINHPFLLI